MAKNNPLFVDSTLHTGDSIGTQIELRGVVVLEGEALYLVLHNHDNEEICMTMEQTGDTDFEVFVRLVHQKRVNFYFGIAKEGELLYKSQTYERIARYALLEEWVPVEERQSAPKVVDDDTDTSTGSKVDVLAELQALAEPPGESSRRDAPANDGVVPSKSNPILMPEDVMNITSLLNKWGFN